MMDERDDKQKDENLDDLQEKINWLKSPNFDPVKDDHPSLSTMCDWLLVGKSDNAIPDYCDTKLFDKFNRLVDTISSCAVYNRERIRDDLDPYNLLGRTVFSTRSGSKLANLDALIKFTNPVDPAGVPLIKASGQIEYVNLTNNTRDMGFTEYMQWRKGKFATGLAFNPNEEMRNMWPERLSKLLNESPLSYHTDEHSTDTPKIESFIAFVHEHFKKGAHLVCSDAVHDSQERLSNVDQIRYFMCNGLIGLATVADNGTFIIKTIDTVSPFMVGMIYLLRLHFREMAIVKLISSRASNTEYYLVFRWKLTRDSAALQQHLLHLNDAMARMTDTEVLQLVPLDVIRADRIFFQHIVDYNNRMFMRNIPIREEIAKYLLEDGFVVVDFEKKERLRKECFRRWNLPCVDQSSDPLIYLEQLYNRYGFVTSNGCVELTTGNVEALLGTKAVADLSEWSAVPINNFVANEGPTFFLGQGGGVVHKLVGNEWLRLAHKQIYLPAGTLVFAELTTEYIDCDNSTTVSLQIMDVLTFAFRYFKPKPMWKRVPELKLIVRYINNDHVCFRVAKPFSLMPGMVNQIRHQWKIIDSKSKQLVVFNTNHTHCYKTVGMLLLPSQYCVSAGNNALFWNWNRDTFEVVNGRGSCLHFGYFEQRLARESGDVTRHTGADKRTYQTGSRPMIFRSGSNKVQGDVD